jgi:CelD/BcsL family acetyltransferase involved in cellulose biosynthesis
LELRPCLKNEVSPERWQKLLDSSAGATVFHTLGWSFSLGASFRDLNLRFIVIEDNDGNYVAGMPFAKSSSMLLSSYRSMPFGTYGGPMAVQGLEEETFPFISAALLGVTKGILPFSFTSVLYNTPVALERALQNAFPNGRRVRVFTHLINLEAGFEKLWDEMFDKETRTCARKAEKRGVKVEEDTTAGGAAVLHSLYRKQAGEWGTARPYPRRLLVNIAGQMRDSAKIWVGKMDGVPVCAVLVFYFKDTVMAWLSGQSEEGRNACASHFIYSQIIRNACEAGYDAFNFGASGELQGVRYFKESFGAREYLYSVFTSEASVFRFARRLKRFAATP